MRGTKPVPTRALLVTALRKRRLQIIMQDEYNTSKVCPNCLSELQHMDRGGQKIWRVKVCKNDDCAAKFWERNVSACINITTRFLCEHIVQAMPDALKRPEADIQINSQTQTTYEGV